MTSSTGTKLLTSPNKQCPSDPIPTWLLKASIDILASFLVSLFTTSLSSGEFPTDWKHGLVYPRLKQPGLDQAAVANYRPVTSLSLLSKFLERIVNKQLTTYLVRNSLLPMEQSAYRQGHSTETVILRIFNDLVDAIANAVWLLFACLISRRSSIPSTTRF